jgi:hypothetical protein
MHTWGDVFWKGYISWQFYTESGRKDTLTVGKTYSGRYRINGVDDGSRMSQSDWIYQEEIFFHLLPTNGLAGP